MLTGPHHLQTEQRRPTNLTCSTPRLRLDILSMKITNGTGDKGQPWRSPTPTGNVSDILPRMRTRLLLQAYRDRIARSNGSGTPYPRSTPPQQFPRDPVESLLQVYKAHVDWLVILPGPLEDPCEGKELVHSSTTGTESALLVLNLRFDQRSEPPFQYPGRNFPREAEKYTRIVRAHSPVSLFENGNHHPGLPVQGHCS